MRALLDSRQLLAVVVLARTGSFTVAGKELFLTQSAVSHAIKAIETELDCALFERTGRGVIVTARGRDFVRYAENIISTMEAARAAIAPNTPERHNNDRGDRTAHHDVPGITSLHTRTELAH